MLRIIASATLLVVLAACSTGTTAPTPPGATLPPGATPAGTGSSQVCAAIPTFNPAGPTPSFAQDTEFLNKMPATIDGQPVTNKNAISALVIFCAFGATSMDQVSQAFAQIGIDIRTMTLGSFGATIDDDSVSVSGFRTPGADASRIIQALPSLALAFGNDPADIQTPTQASAGGKTVFTTPGDEEGTLDYFYVQGDTIWNANSITQSQADKLFAALP